MTHPFYQFTPSAEALRFDFISTGQRIIRKVIVYEKLPFPEVYNLALGDVDEEGQVDFAVTSDNGDRNVVLATVVQTLIAFLERHPRASVFIAGSTPSRTRLYQGVITLELEDIQTRFDIMGVAEGDTEPFERNKPYEAFVISLKQA